MSAKNYELYREATTQTTSFEATAQLDQPSFSAALDDPRTLRVQRAGLVLPYALPTDTDIMDLSWINRPYFGAHHGVDEDKPVYVTVLPPGEQKFTSDSEALLHDIYSRSGVILAEYPSLPGSTRESKHGEAILNHALAGTRLTAVDESKGHRHFHYVNRLLPYGNPENTSRPAIDAIYDAQYRKDEVKVEAALKPADIEAVWEFYNPSHERIAKTDPIKAGFSHDELAIVLGDSGILKFVSRDSNGRILNVALLGDIQNPMIASLINPEYYKQHHPHAFAVRHILFSAGIFKNPNAAKDAPVSSQATIGHIATLLKRLRISVELSYACNPVSNRIVPRLAQLVFPEAGVEIERTEPVSEQAYGVYRLSTT